jgi:hypothetical protein
MLEDCGDWIAYEIRRALDDAGREDDEVPEPDEIASALFALHSFSRGGDVHGMTPQDWIAVADYAKGLVAG